MGKTKKKDRHGDRRPRRGTRGGGKTTPAEENLFGKPVSSLLTAILVVGLLLHLLYFWTISGTSLVQHHAVMVEADDHAFFEWARTIVDGDWLGRDTYHPYFSWMRDKAPLATWYRWWGGKEIYHQSPFYPYFLAVLFGLSQYSVRFVFLVQLLLGALQPLLQYRLTARLFDARAGLLAAALTALYGPFTFQQGLLLRDWIPPLLEPLVLLLLLRARDLRRGWVWAGAVMGLALAAKETALLLLPVALVWIAYEYRAEWQHMLRVAALVATGFLAALSPIYLRNAIVGAPILSLSTRGAEVVPMSLSSKPEISARRLMEQSRGNLITLARLIISSYAGDWSSFYNRMLRRLTAIVDTYEDPDNISYSYGQSVSKILKILPGYWVIFPLGVAGFLLSLASWRRYLLVSLYGLACGAGLLITDVRGRYRLTLVPILILFAAIAIVRLVDAVRSRKFRAAAISAGLIAALCCGQQLLSSTAAADSTGRVRAVDYRASARAYVNDKRYDRAAEEMARLLQRARGDSSAAVKIPLYEAEYYLFLAQDCIQKKDMLAARHQLERGLEIYERGPNAESHPYYEMGLVFLQLNDGEKAIELFHRYLDRDPSGPYSEDIRQILVKLE